MRSRSGIAEDDEGGSGAGCGALGCADATGVTPSATAARRSSERKIGVRLPRVVQLIFTVEFLAVLLGKVEWGQIGLEQVGLEQAGYIDLFRIALRALSIAHRNNSTIQDYGISAETQISDAGV